MCIRSFPVATKRAVVKLDVKKEENEAENAGSAIAESAAKQSKRNDHSAGALRLMTFGQALEYAETLDITLIAL